MLENIDLYRLSECQTLAELEKGIDTIEVKQVTDRYHQLQWNAWVFACYHRGAPAAWDTYLRDWVKYGKLYDLWALT